MSVQKNFFLLPIAYYWIFVYVQLGTANFVICYYKHYTSLQINEYNFCNNVPYIEINASNVIKDHWSYIAFVQAALLYSSFNFSLKWQKVFGQKLANESFEI